VYGDTGMREMGKVVGGIYMRDCGVDDFHHIMYLVLFHLISSHYTTTYTLHHSYRIISLALCDTSRS
jgi:hypothetical protein